MLRAAPQAAAEVGPDYMLGDDVLLLYMEQLSEDLKLYLANCSVVRGLSPSLVTGAQLEGFALSADEGSVPCMRLSMLTCSALIAVAACTYCCDEYVWLRQYGLPGLPGSFK